jgi:hypothetical protein
MRLLITGGKSVQALKLVAAYVDDTVILADYGEVPLFPSAKYRFVSLGERNDEIIAHNLLNHCLDLEVDAIMPLHAFEIDQVGKAAVLFEEFNIQVLTPETTNIIAQ